MNSFLHARAVTILFGVSLFCASVHGLAAQKDQQAPERLERARRNVKEDITAAREELAALREKVESRRVKMVDRVKKLRRQVRNLEDKLADREAEQDKKKEQLRDARSRLRTLREAADTVAGATSEFRRGFETGLSAARTQSFGEELKHVDNLLQAEKELRRLDAVPEVVEMAGNHLHGVLAGARFSGAAVGEDGSIYKGRFAEIGPVSYFAAPQGPAGLAIQQTGNVEPTVFSRFASDNAADGIRSVVQGGTASVPVDPTLGAAVKLRQSEGGWIQHLRKGGLTMIPLLGLAAVCACIAVYKFIALHLIGAGRNEQTVRRVLDALRRDRPAEARDIADSCYPPLGPVLVEGIEHSDAPKEHLEEIMYERLLSQVPVLKRFLSALSVCATVAPLLGLLGTVTGMIHTFQLITVFGTGDAGTLSSGISEALVTTEFGLIIAVPALLAHAYLSRRVNKAVSRTQQAAIMFVNGLTLAANQEEDGDGMAG